MGVRNVAARVRRSPHVPEKQHGSPRQNPAALGERSGQSLWRNAACGCGRQARGIIYVLPDTRMLGRDIEAATRADHLLRDSIVYLTCLHESGHALGLPHTAAFADIMYTFRYGGDIVGISAVSAVAEIARPTCPKIPAFRTPTDVH